MSRAKLWRSIPKRLAAVRACLAASAVAIVLAVSNQAQAGFIVSSSDDGAGVSIADASRWSSGDGSDPADERVDTSDDFALPTDAGTSTNTTSNTTSSSTGVSAILPQACGVSSSAFSAGLGEERALQMPPSPFFDHLRPPQA